MSQTTEVTKLLIDIAVPLPVTGLFTYAVPAELEPKIKRGVRVSIPFRNRELIGYLVDRKEAADDISCKDIKDILDDEPVLSGKVLELTKWISEYYGSSWGEAIENALPRWVKYGKKAERALQKESIAEVVDWEKKEDFNLTDDQKRALEAIRSGFLEENPKPILLYGITGSGKSEVYIRAIRDILKQNQSAICLVPEIALTEQIKRFFHDHFGDELEILHSKLNDTERFLAWKRLESGRKRVVLGPRSAIFAPVPNLGLIIIDEEHENSYKQETNPRYHAREVAQFRAQNENAVMVLGSATPSLETMYKAETGEIVRLDLTSRIEDRPLPEVHIVDLKNSGPAFRKKGILSFPLATEIEKNLKAKEGTLLLLNRRGFSTHIHCPKCGYVEQCDSCQVSLTFHQEDNSLLCHYCNAEKPVPVICGQCKSPMLKFAGFGTEKVESEVAKQFPTARISRLDADSVRRKGSHEKILKGFREGNSDILIGTQMIAKGFDFPHVTLVGVILADVGLMLPDFRSAERTFQLLTQVAGRAGRGSQPGRVYVQTFSPDHPSVKFSKNHDYLNFYKQELPERHLFHYPPAYQLMNIIVRSREEKKVYLFSRELRDQLRKEFQGIMSGDNPAPGQSEWAQIVGPSPLPFYKLRGHFRWHIMIKFARGMKLAGRVSQCLASLRKPAAVQVAIDVDPLSIL
ncbi:MAG: primosomal protein N' [Candidatus Omnitrophica bacterium]|nr:primosomal protein N' [Candidatus Omnitrophota bacterium]